MGKRNAQRAFLLGASAAAGLMMLASCNDFLTGQDGEPHGPLKVTKLTLNDNGLSRPSGGVVTDTSVPADCTADAVKDLPQCNADPFGDKYGVIKSPPNPDSANLLRVVFNKAPMNLAGAALEPVPEVGLPSAAMPLKLADPTVLKLTCQNCSTDSAGNMGVPPSYNSLQLTGTDLSPDPSQYAYGPGLQMEVIAECDDPTMLPSMPTKCQLAGPTYVTDEFRALEPGATYSVVINSMLQGRLMDGSDTVQLDDAAKALLTFTTEAFKSVVVGIGQGTRKDTTPAMKVIKGFTHQVDGTTDFGDGTAATPYLVDTQTMDPVTMAKTTVPHLDNTGAVVLGLNAPADESMFTAQTASATVTVNGTTTSVAVKISTATGTLTMCDFGNRRSLYIAPVSGTWMTTLVAGAVVNVTLRGSEVRDLSQLPGHPPRKGVHVLSKDINIQATLLGTSDPTTYGGVTAVSVIPASGC